MDWKVAWSYLPVNYNTCIGTISNITQRAFFRNNLNGTKIKIKFSNLYTEAPLIFHKVVIGKKNRDKDYIEEMMPITYQGSERILIKPENEFYSDEVEFTISKDEDIVLSIYIKDETKIYSLCTSWAAQSWHSGYALQGDYTMNQNIADNKGYDVFPILQFDPNRADTLFGISEIRVLTDSNVKTIALFGDSITHMSYYCDALIDILYKNYPGKITVVNRGLGGNRLLHDYSVVPEMPSGGAVFGTAGNKRFYFDIYSSDQPEYVFVLIGINDFTHPYALQHYNETVTEEEYRAGITQLIDIAHKNGSKIMIGTITPFKSGETDWFSLAENLRQRSNEWIREQTLSDGIIDFDLAVRQSEKPELMIESCHIGDGLHPNAEGGRKMADAIPITWFQ